MEAESKLDPDVRPEPVTEEFCSIDDVARFIGKERIDRKTLFSAARRGELPGVRRIGRRFLVHLPTFMEWFTSAGQSAPPVGTGNPAVLPVDDKAEVKTPGQPT